VSVRWWVACEWYGLGFTVRQILPLLPLSLPFTEPKCGISTLAVGRQSGPRNAIPGGIKEEPRFDERNNLNENHSAYYSFFDPITPAFTFLGYYSSLTPKPIGPNTRASL